MKGFRALFLTALCGALLGCSKRPPAEVAPPTAVGARTQGVDARDSGDTAPPPRVLDERQRFHALSRLTFGPTVASMRHLEQLGLEAWLDEQLAPAKPPSAELKEALGPYKKALGTPGELVRTYQYDAAARLRRGMQEPPSGLPEFERLVLNGDQIAMLRDLQMAEMTRHLLNEQQLREVVVDFWTNHFNIYTRKDRVAFAAADYLETAIRPHALNSFAELLAATARHPAMLQYLDNGRNRTPSRQGSGGVNENYARELLELHTVGVQAGYTQKDVAAAAHILTGWSVQNTTEGEFGFVFRSDWHTPGPQVVWGKTLDADGMQQGHDLLRWLGTHPATARHVGAKLCTRFVADVPPASCISAATEAFMSTGGAITEVLRAIVNDESFWSTEHNGQMVKTPLEFLMSAVRAVEASLDGSHGLVDQINALRQPPLFYRVPTGYSTLAEAWASTDGMMQRFLCATRLASGRGGVILPDTAFAAANTPEALQQTFAQQFPLVSLRPQMLEAFMEPLLAVERPQRRPMLAISMFLSSAEFQQK